MLFPPSFAQFKNFGEVHRIHLFYQFDSTLLLQRNRIQCYVMGNNFNRSDLLWNGIVWFSQRWRGSTDVWRRSLHKRIYIFILNWKTSIKTNAFLFNESCSDHRIKELGLLVQSVGRQGDFWLQQIENSLNWKTTTFGIPLFTCELIRLAFHLNLNVLENLLVRFEMQGKQTNFTFYS